MAEPGNVSADDVEWVATTVRHNEMPNQPTVGDYAERVAGIIVQVNVKARLWYDARKIAMQVLGCGPDELEVAQCCAAQ